MVVVAVVILIKSFVSGLNSTKVCRNTVSTREKMG